MRVRAKALIFTVTASLAAAPLVAQVVSDSAAFIKAVKEEDGAKAIALLGAPGSTVAKSRDGSTGDTALHIKVRERDSAWTQFLLQNGVDPNSGNRSGETPLGLASRLGWSEGVRLLLARGARVDGSNNSGQTALILAVQNLQLAPGARVQLVQMLLRKGADPDKTDNVGLSARDYAKQDRRGAAVLRAFDEKRVPAARAPAGPPPPKAQ